MVVETRSVVQEGLHEEHYACVASVVPQRPAAISGCNRNEKPPTDNGPTLFDV